MRRKSMKRILICVLSCMLIALLCACSPASKDEAERYVKSNFGKAEYIRTEEVDDREVIYYFQDKEYGFEYYVTSYVSDILIDGAKFGETESKGSNFEEVYYTYVLSQVKDELTALEESYGVVILDGLNAEAQLDYKYQFAEICTTSEAGLQGSEEDALTASQVAGKVHDLFAAYDTREYWQDMRVAAYDAQGEKLGIYSYKYDRWLTPQEERDVRYWEEIQNLNDDAKFSRKEQRVFRDTGLDLSQIPTILGSEPTTEDTIVTYYYFTVKGKEYFLADILVSVDGAIRWYTNYEED